MNTAGSGRGVIASSAIYYAAHAIGMLAGLLSMPVTTRLLSREEFGVLSLVLVTVTLIGAFGRLGFPQATTRFYATWRTRGRGALVEFCNAMLTGAVAGGVGAALVALALLSWLAGGNHAVIAPMRLALLVVVIRVAGAVIFEIYRASEDVWTFAVVQVLLRWAPVLLSIALLIAYQRSAYAVVLGLVVAEGVVTGASAVGLVRRGAITGLRWSRPATRAATAYGLPLTIVGAGSFLLQYGDRYLIGRFLGLDAVAIYTVPYDLATNLATMLFLPLQLATLPIAFRLWAEEGAESTARFTSQLLTYALAMAVPLGTLFLLLNRELILVFASEKYGTSASLTPYLLPGVLMDQLTFVAAFGLRVLRSTVAAAGITLAGAALNVALNLVLLPLLGLTGAAVATTLAYGAILVASYAYARQALVLHVHYRLILKSMLATAVMAVLVTLAARLCSSVFIDLLIRGTLGVAVVVLAMLALDRDLRTQALDRLRPLILGRQRDRASAEV
ncbi:lipopolysaccharide biosynthesis protein [Candidatus Binatia bacterium]|nr:lipopolysaccharide biosynthesis protein [Candidatus Binatia bacterium]